MALSITPVAGSRAVVPGIVAWPAVFEALVALIAIAALLPLFRIVALEDTGRGGRFSDEPAAVAGLPLPVLPKTCGSVGPRADASLRERLCPGLGARSSGVPIEPAAAALVDTTARASAAFTASLRNDEAQLAQLRTREQESAPDSPALRDAILKVDARIRTFSQRYAIDGGGGPAPLRCASASIATAVHAAPSSRSDNADVARAANAVLLLGAALDGHPAVGMLARQAALPVASRLAPRTCGTFGLAEALGRTSLLMADARQATTTNAKNQAMRELLRTAGWQWAAAMVIGLGFVTLSRRVRSATPGVALALAVWAVAAWAGRVPWPLAAERAFLTGRDAVSLLTPPAPFVGWLLAAAVILLIAIPALRKPLRCSPQAPSSRLGYGGFVALTGVGWLVLLDLSANASFANRYLALYHHGHLWLAMLLFSMLVFLRQPLGRFLAWTLSVIDGAASRIGRFTGTLGAAALAVLATAALVSAFAVLLSNLPQVTSEIGRLWLMLGAAWFFFLRGTPLAERLAQSDGSLRSFVRYVIPLAFVVVVLIGAMILTHDMGPLLIAGYGGGAFLAASVAMWMHQRYGVSYTAHAIAMAVFVGWIALVTFALFETGAVDATTAGRLENLAAPLASANDQLAIVTWFQQAAPPAGFGLGHVPWCGYGGAVGCAGVPAQVHSDYTFTALVGAFGWTAAWTVTLGCAVWLHRLIRQHGRITTGEPRLVAGSTRLVNDEQGFLSWLAVTWVVLALCQLAVTVAGNLAVIPLTGVTFPFVSFGMTSLVVNAALLALCLNVNLPARGRG